jgi:hypothetical protein
MSALMMEAANTSERSVNVFQTTWCNNPEESHQQGNVYEKHIKSVEVHTQYVSPSSSHHAKNLKSNLVPSVLFTCNVS